LFGDGGICNVLVLASAFLFKILKERLGRLDLFGEVVELVVCLGIQILLGGPLLEGADM